jgi:hypothetical protein
MSTRSAAAVATRDPDRADQTSATYSEGIVAGLLGAATIAVWFLIVDTVNGRPLYTPTVLGTAIFRQGVGLESPETLPISFEMVFLFTWVHALVFAAIGGVAAHLLAYAEHTANVGFGIVLLFVIFEFGFVAVTTVFAGDVLASLAWPAVLAGNLLAAGAMGAYFWRRHPNLEIEP